MTPGESPGPEPLPDPSPDGGGRVGGSYPLSALQQGMLLHSLKAQGSGVDILQEIADLEEELDVDAFERAWHHVARRHPMMRTSFAWADSASPVQSAHDTVPRLDRRDWRSLSANEQDAAFDAFLLSDRGRDFEMDRAPLMRLAIFRLGTAAHRIVWTLHHALMDGWCVPIVWREVFAAYDALRDGREAALGTPRPYRDYVEWLGGLDLSGSESFWRDLLKEFRGSTPLAVDRAVRKGEDRPLFHGEEVARLSERLTSSLRTLAATHSLTLNTIVQGAWACLLGRYSGEEDVVFGATRQCRPTGLAGAESMVGLFINTLPVRARVSSDRPLLEMLQELRARWLAMRDYKYTSLGEIRAWNGIPRETSLFESLVVFEHERWTAGLHALGGPWFHRTFRAISQPDTPLNLLAYGERELLLRIVYERARFDRDAVVRMLGHLSTMFEAIAEDIAMKIGSLPMLTHGERRRLLEWSSSRRQFGGDEPIHGAVERQARRIPGAIAVEFEGTRVTYAELDRRANRLARHLRGLGVGPEVLVGVCLDRSIELVVAFLAVLKAGGAYLPLDPEYPVDRLANMIEDAQARVLITDKTHARALPASSAVAACLLDRDAAAIGREEDGPLDVAVSPDDLAYVIYTSGSTGKPKGVLVTHRNVDRLFAATEDWFHFDEHDVWSLFHSSAFDFSVWEMWGSLRYGGRLAVVPHWMTRSPDAFRTWLSESGVTVLNQTPTAFRQLVEADAGAAPGSPLRLRVVILGGEALEPEILEPWFERHGDESPRLVNMYGITETTVHVTYHPLSRADLDRPTRVIGRPIPDLRVYLLDRRGELCPIGVPGELHVGGPGVARGYLDRPELTAERFIPSPFPACEGDRLYRSGDLARYLANGEIEYLGRIDQQVKIRGHRVELGEIETTLARHPEIRECAVAAAEEKTGGVRLIAYVIARRQRAPSDEDLRAFLKRSLPSHMIPAAFHPVDRITKTPGGKIDRRALQSPLDPGSGRRDDYVAPRNDTERAVAEIWGEMLGIEGLGALDDFFERGGHSLMAMQVVSRVRDAFGVDLPVRVLFDSSSVAAFADSIEAAPKADRPETAIPRRTRIAKAGIPASSGATAPRAGLPGTRVGEADPPRAGPPDARSRAGGDRVAVPGTETERAVAGIWEVVLGLEGLGAHDDFFERGGTSFLAMLVVSRIRDAFGVDLPVRALFDSSRLGEFAAVVSATPKAAASAAAIPRQDRDARRHSANVPSAEGERDEDPWPPG